MKQPSQHSAAAEHEQRERKRVTAGGGGGGSRRIEGGSEEEGGGGGDFEGGSEEEGGGGGGGEIQIQEGRQGCSSSSPVARDTMVMSPAAMLSATRRSPATPIALVSTPNAQGPEDVVAEYYQQQVEVLEGFNEMDTLTDRGFLPGMSKLPNIKGIMILDMKKVRRDKAVLHEG